MSKQTPSILEWFHQYQDQLSLDALDELREITRPLWDPTQTYLNRRVEPEEVKATQEMKNDKDQASTPEPEASEKSAESPKTQEKLPKDSIDRTNISQFKNSIHEIKNFHEEDIPPLYDIKNEEGVRAIYYKGNLIGDIEGEDNEPTVFLDNGEIKNFYSLMAFNRWFAGRVEQLNWNLVRETKWQVCGKNLFQVWVDDVYVGLVEDTKECLILRQAPDRKFEYESRIALAKHQSTRIDTWRYLPSLETTKKEQKWTIRIDSIVVGTAEAVDEGVLFIAPNEGFEIKFPNYPSFIGWLRKPFTRKIYNDEYKEKTIRIDGLANSTQGTLYVNGQHQGVVTVCPDNKIFVKHHNENKSFSHLGALYLYYCNNASPEPERSEQEKLLYIEEQERLYRDKVANF